LTNSILSGVDTIALSFCRAVPRSDFDNRDAFPSRVVGIIADCHETRKHEELLAFVLRDFVLIEPVIEFHSTLASPVALAAMNGETTPSPGARIGSSIFIASSSISTWPFATPSPAFTWTVTIVAGIGAVRCAAPSSRESRAWWRRLPEVAAEDAAVPEHPAVMRGAGDVQGLGPAVDLDSVHAGADLVYLSHGSQPLDSRPSTVDCRLSTGVCSPPRAPGSGTSSSAR
jgi:hypothetical protein